MIADPERAERFVAMEILVLAETKVTDGSRQCFPLMVLSMHRYDVACSHVAARGSDHVAVRQRAFDTLHLRRDILSHEHLRQQHHTRSGR